MLERDLFISLTSKSAVASCTNCGGLWSAGSQGVAAGAVGGYEKASWKALSSKTPLYVKQEERDSLQKCSNRNEKKGQQYEAQDCVARQQQKGIFCSAVGIHY